MRKIAAFVAIGFAAASSFGAAREQRGAVAVGAYYRISIPAAGEDAGSSWTGGAARLRYDWSDALAFTAAFTYDRHEFPESPPDVADPGEAVERQLLSFRGGIAFDMPLSIIYPYAGGGAVLAREKTYFWSGRLEPKVLYHPGLYGEAGVNVPLVGPLVVDAGPEFVVLLRKRVAAYDAAAREYRYDDGAALYFGLKAGVAVYF
jgi:hypothetical protein